MILSMGFLRHVDTGASDSYKSSMHIKSKQSLFVNKKDDSASDLTDTLALEHQTPSNHLASYLNKVVVICK